MHYTEYFTLFYSNYIFTYKSWHFFKSFCCCQRSSAEIPCNLKGVFSPFALNVCLMCSMANHSRHWVHCFPVIAMLLSITNYKSSLRSGRSSLRNSPESGCRSLAQGRWGSDQFWFLEFAFRVWQQQTPTPHGDEGYTLTHSKCL